MIRRLKGTLVESDLTRVLIDVHGIGFDVSIPLSTYEKLPVLGQEATLWIYTNVREDAIELFGFATAEERELYMLLISVSGIGPKSALNVLSCMPISQFTTAVSTNDLKTLQRINGVGKKSAERLVLELRDKINVFGTASSASGTAFSPAAADAILALEHLGFKAESVRKTVEKVLSDAANADLNSEQIIRKALALLNS